MQTAEKHVNSKTGHEENKEGQNYEEMIMARTAKPGNAAIMESHGIDHHRHQCPRLLGVSTPILAPREICPYRSHKDANGKTCH